MSNSQSPWQPTLSEQEKEIVFRTTGMTCDEIRDMDIDEIHARIEKKIGKKLTFKPKKKMRLIGRFPFLSHNRTFPMDQNKFDEFIDSLK